MKTLKKKLMKIFELIHAGFECDHEEAAKKLIKFLKKNGICGGKK
jgi:hypothetical protein